MRRVLLAGVLLSGSFSGCLGGDAPDDGGPGDGATAEPAYGLDCSIGTAHWVEGCLAHVSMNPSPAKTEIDLAVNPANPANVIVGAKDLDRSASDCVWSVLYVTKDAGATWKTVYVGGTKDDRHPMLASFECVTDPIMVFDAEGVAYYALQAYRLMPTWSLRNLTGDPLYVVGSTFLLARSTDGGDTWEHVIPLHAGDGTIAFHDYPRMAVNPATGSIYTVWNQVGNTGAFPVLVASRDGGETAAPPVYVTPTERAGGAGMTGLTAGTDGTAYLMLLAGTEAWLSISTDDARTFSMPVHVFDLEAEVPRDFPNAEFRAGSFVELVIDVTGGPRDGRLYAVYDDFGPGHGEVMLRWSNDGGTTWSEPVRINADETATDQWMVRPTISSDGALHVVYFDRARDPENRLIDATYAFSLDGGATWTTQRLTERMFDGDLGTHQSGYPFIGDYLGIGTGGDHVFMGFPTTVTGVAEVAVARVERAG